MTRLAYCVGWELWKAPDYLKEQVRVWKEQQEKDTHFLLDNHRRIRLLPCRFSAESCGQAWPCYPLAVPL